MASTAGRFARWLRSPDFRAYLLSTHFWVGRAARRAGWARAGLTRCSNFGIPVAAVLDLQRDPEYISGRMTGALVLYSATFMRYAMAVTPKNYLLFACHVINATAQSAQGVRWINYWYLGDRTDRA